MDFEEKVLQFVSVTDSSDATARKYLEACAGDVDMAIGMHMENQVTVDSAGSDSPQTVAPSVAHASEDLLSPNTYEKVYVVAVFLTKHQRNCAPIPLVNSPDLVLFYCLFLFSHGIRAPIPQTTGVLIEEDVPPR